MTEPKEFESLDELFRKTFKDLPETPSPSGWDTPSERVWQHVQTQIKPPKSGWGTQTLTLIAAFAVTLAVGLYLVLNRPEQPETPAASPPPIAVEPVEQQQAAAVEAEPTSPSMPVSETKTSKKKTATAENKASRDKAAPNAEKTAKPDAAVENAEKPGGKKPVSPNTTERRKAELAKRAEEAWKKPLQPLPQRWPGKPKE